MTGDEREFRRDLRVLARLSLSKSAIKILLPILAIAVPLRAGTFDDLTIPGKWIKPLLPESGNQPDYPSYDLHNTLEMARDQYWAGQYRRALVTLENVHQSKKAVDAAILRGKCDLELGRCDDAMAALSIAALADNSAAQTLRARVLAAQGGYLAGIGILQREIQRHPEVVAPHYYLGAFREKLGDFPGAMAAYQWFVTDPHNYLQQWLGHPETFDDAEQVTLIGLAVDRWATLTMAYQREFDLHNVILNMFVKAYDQIDRGYWPAHLAAAQCFFDHDDPPSAADELEQAMAANPNDIQCWVLAGKMQLGQFDFDGADKAVREIRDVNPDSVDADLLEARNLLLQQAPKLAMPALQRVLARQPRNIEALGLLAGAEAALVQDQKCAEILKQADEIEPASPVAYFEAAEQLAALRQYPRSEVMYQVAVRRAPWWTAARNGLGLLYTQSGDEQAARRVLEAAHTLDPFNYSTTNYLRLMDMMDKFATSESAHFIVRYDAQTDPIIPEYFNAYLESIYPQVCGLFHFEPKVKTIIEVFPTQDEFAVRTTGAPWLPTVGASTGRIIALDAPRKGERTMGAFNWSQVLHHEFTHTVTLGATDNRISHWFTEGLAVQQEHSPLRWEWVPMLYDAVAHHRLFPIDELTWAFVRPRRPSDRQLAYAQSYWICQFIEQTYGHQAILGMMEQYRLGHIEDEVFQNVFHRSETQFSDDFYRWCEVQISGWGYDEATSRKYDLLRQEGEDLIHQRQYPQAAVVWEQIVKLRPEDILPHKRLAGLYKVCNEPEKSAEQLAILAAVEVQNNMYAKATARTYEGIGKYDDAIKWARKAVYTDPYDLDAHQTLAGLDQKIGDTKELAREQKVMDILQHWNAN